MCFMYLNWWEQIDLNYRRLEPGHLQCPAIDHYAILPKKMAARVRFERTSTKLTVLRITIILPSSFKLAFPTGIEPVTESLEGFCSNPTELRER